MSLVNAHHKYSISIYAKYSLGLSGLFLFVLLLYRINIFYSESILPLRPTPLTLEVNKHYQLVSHSNIIPTFEPTQTVSVIEFFSYHCDVCHTLQPAIQAWLLLQSQSLRFEQIPVMDDNRYSKMIVTKHYQCLYKGTHVIPLLFKWLQDDPLLTHTDRLNKNILKLGLRLEDYDHCINQHTNVDSYMMRSHQLEKYYAIDEIPTFIIGERYKTNLSMADGNLLQLFEIIDRLIEKVKKGEH